MTSPPAQSGINLPLELCLEIISYVVKDAASYNSCQRTLKALRLVDRAFCNCATAELFKSMTIRFNGHDSNILPWIPEGIKSLALSNRRFFVKEICLRDESPYESPCCMIEGADSMEMDALEELESDIPKMEIKEVDHSNSRIYRELPELLSSFPNVTFLKAHMWYSRPLDDLFFEMSRPLKEVLGSWLLTHAPQKLSNVRIIDERQAAPCPPFWQNVYEFKAETQISRCEEARDELAISPDQLDCAFTYLKLEQESEFESWNQSRAFFMPPFIRFCIRFCTDISDFDEAEGDAVGDEHDGNNDDPSPPATTGSAAALGGYSLAAALLPPADITDMEYISDMEEY